jgi:hypothetical protein
MLQAWSRMLQAWSRMLQAWSRMLQAWYRMLRTSNAMPLASHVAYLSNITNYFLPGIPVRGVSFGFHSREPGTHINFLRKDSKRICEHSVVFKIGKNEFWNGFAFLRNGTLRNGNLDTSNSDTPTQNWNPLWNTSKAQIVNNLKDIKFSASSK